MTDNITLTHAHTHTLRHSDAGAGEKHLLSQTLLNLIHVVVILLALACHVVAAELPTVEEIRERMDAIGIRSVRSADGELVVSGADSFKNAILLAQMSEIRARVSTVIGQQPPFDADSVRALIASASDDSAPITLEHTFSGGLWIHRVVFPHYAACDTPAAGQALCAAFLAQYVPQTPGRQSPSFMIPVWLCQGVQQVLTDEDRSRTIEQALKLWREGRLPSPLSILNDRESTESDETLSRKSVAYGAFVIWLADQPSESRLFTRLFERIGAGNAIDASWLRDVLDDGKGPDEQWDRWILSQRHVVRLLGTLNHSHLNALRDQWLIAPGVYGVPRDLDLSPGADCVSLLAYRDKGWFGAAIRQERYQLEMLAQGRPERFRQVIVAYVKVLDAMESGSPPAAVVGMAVTARNKWQQLRDAVEQAGGELSVP